MALHPLERLRQLIQPDALKDLDLSAFGELLRAYLPAKVPRVGCSSAAAPYGEVSGKGCSHRDILPLPVGRGRGFEHLYRQTRAYRELEVKGDWAGRRRALPEPPGLEAWLECCIVALNTMWLEGDARWPRPTALGQARRVTAARVRAFWTLERRVEAFLGTVPEALPAEEAATWEEVSDW